MVMMFPLNFPPPPKKTSNFRMSYPKDGNQITLGVSYIFTRNQNFKLYLRNIYFKCVTIYL